MLYFEKVRELGNLILDSEEAQRLAKATVAYDQSPELASKLEYDAAKKDLLALVDQVAYILKMTVIGDEDCHCGQDCGACNHCY